MSDVTELIDGLRRVHIGEGVTGKAADALERLQSRNELLEVVVEAAKELAKSVDDWAADAGGYDPAWFLVEDALAAVKGEIMMRNLKDIL